MKRALDAKKLTIEDRCIKYCFVNNYQGSKGVNKKSVNKGEKSLLDKTLKRKFSGLKIHETGSFWLKMTVFLQP